ncbi:glycosyltransferase [Myroides sp. DW712]|uniref:glycosyltransferase n=1 Tax=Myroides sp. DW712 TaxID=3389800 RepID=UPI00397869BB
MRILLIGDYSGLHSALKKGLLHHPAIKEVVLVGDGDKFKDFQVDVSLRPKWAMSPWGTFFRKAIHKVCRWDIAELEIGWSGKQAFKNLKDFDVVQLINDRPLQTVPSWERRLLKRLFAQNKRVFLLSCGIDVFGLQYLIAHPEEISLLQPLLDNPALKSHYDYVEVYRKKGVRKTQRLIVERCSAIIASDMDYVNPNKHHPKYVGLLPHPVVVDDIVSSASPENTNTVCIFLGINRGNYIQKGIVYFEEALAIIQRDYNDQIEIVVAEQLPYARYKKEQERADIVLDQVFSKDQGYNALEAMARGKVVFTGASEDFLQQYNLKEGEVCVDAKPNVAYLVAQLKFWIEHPLERKELGQRAQAFVREIHDCKTIANQYVKVWKSKK